MYRNTPHRTVFDQDSGPWDKTILTVLTETHSMMDSVPVDFSERVLAMRKCCEQKSGCSCRSPRFAAPMWNQQPEEKRLSFNIGVSGGEWRYQFSESTKLKSLDEVMRLKNARVCEFTVANYSLNYNIEDMEKLLHVVSFLSNEPSLHVQLKDQSVGCSQGEKVLKWLAESWFSYVYVTDLTTLPCQIIENQFSRWKPTPIIVAKMQENSAFVENRLMSGDLRRFSLHELYQFPSAVLVRIIENVLEAQEDYRTNGIAINVCFDDSVTALLNEMTESGRCRRVAGDGQHYKYIFDNQAPILKVENLHEHFSRWKLECVGQQN